jgi:hypothetical protein
MALSQSAMSELLEAFRTGDGVDMIRESVRTVLQELVEFEASGAIGAGCYERTEDRVTLRSEPRASTMALRSAVAVLILASTATRTSPTSERHNENLVGLRGRWSGSAVSR